MANLTVNGIWKKYIEPLKVTFKEWYAKELVEYESKERKCSFDVYVNRKYSLNGVTCWNNLVSKTSKKSVEEANLGAVSLAIEQQKEKSSSEFSNANTKEKIEDVPILDKKPLGMPPALTWGLILTSVIVLGYAGVQIFKHYKKGKTE